MSDFDHSPKAPRRRRVKGGQHVELGDALGFLFRRLSSLADAAFVAKANEPDLTPMQMGVLLTVNRVSHLSLRELAREMHADRSTVQELVKRMTDRGLLDRRVGEQDRRMHELWVTPAGQDLLTRNLRIVDEVQRELLSGFTEEEGEHLVTLLQRLLAGHEASAPAS